MMKICILEKQKLEFICGENVVIGRCIKMGSSTLDSIQDKHKSIKNKKLKALNDKTHNINNMANALQKAGIDYYGFQYTKINKTVSAQEVKHAQLAASDLSKLLSEHFIERANQITNGSCAY